MPAYTPDNIALQIIAQGRRDDITSKGIVIAIATGLVESNLTMYANPADPESMTFPHDAVGSDANSVGVFQQRAPWWGTVADRMDPARSAHLFFDALKRVKPPYTSDERSPGAYAQMVQQSAFPDRYDQRMADATAIYDRLRDDHAAPPVGETTEPAPLVAAPQFTELDYMTGGGASSRTRPVVNWFIHTEEGDSSAEQLAKFCDGSHDVSYHYTVRDGVVCDVVDTDLASWSVLDANVFSINGCFAGSHAAWSRDEWLQRERDIEIMAYLAVQDCRKYGFSTAVIAPPYHKDSGISDHRYVTQCLGIGTHVDVGDGFPWDVFARYVDKYTGQPAAPPTPQAPVLDANRSRSFFSTDGQPIGDTDDFVRNADANAWNLLISEAYFLGVPYAVEQVSRVAAGTFPDGAWISDPDQQWLRDFAVSYCKGLLAKKGNA